MSKVLIPFGSFDSLVIHTLIIYSVVTFIAHSSHVGCTFQSRLLHIPVMFVAHSSHVCCTFQSRLLHIPVTFIAHSSHVGCTFQSRLLHIPVMFVAHSSHVGTFDYDPYETAECHDNSTDMKPLLIMRNISIQFNSKID